MLEYKKVKIPKKNLPESINSGEFKKLWIKSLSDKSSNLSDFLTYINPFIIKVKNQLRSRRPFDYFLISLLRFIDSDLTKALKKLKEWCMDSDVESEITLIIIERLRALKKIPFRARPLMAEYYFVLDFKYALSKKIKSHRRQYSIQKKEKYTYLKLPITTKNKWYNYLIKLYIEGYSTSDIAKLTKLSRKTIIKEGEKIWECLKQKQ